MTVLRPGNNRRPAAGATRDVGVICLQSRTVIPVRLFNVNPGGPVGVIIIRVIVRVSIIGEPVEVGPGVVVMTSSVIIPAPVIATVMAASVVRASGMTSSLMTATRSTTVRIKCHTQAKEDKYSDTDDRGSLFHPVPSLLLR